MSDAVGFVLLVLLRLLGRLSPLLGRDASRKVAEELFRVYGKFREKGRPD